jgi:hypothetical protein
MQYRLLGEFVMILSESHSYWIQRTLRWRMADMPRPKSVRLDSLFHHCMIWIVLRVCGGFSHFYQAVTERGRGKCVYKKVLSPTYIVLMLLQLF